MADTEEEKSAQPPITEPRGNWWTGFVGYAKRKKYERKAKKQKETPTDKAARVTAAATKWMAVFTFFLAAVSGVTILVLKNQLSEAQAARQPWAGLEDNTINVVPSVHFFWSGPPHTVKHPLISVTVAYSVKNFGLSPALYETDSISAYAYHDGLKPLDTVKRFCAMQEDFSKAGAETSGAGEMILPGARKQSRLSTNIQLDSGQTHIEGIWIVVCIAYEDSLRRMHHSSYLYLTAHRDLGAEPPIMANPEYPEWTYVPITGVDLDSAQAK